MHLIEWLNKPNADGVPKMANFDIAADVGIGFVEKAQMVFFKWLTNSLPIFQYFHSSQQPATFYATIEMNGPIEQLASLPRVQTNSIGEKFIMEHQTFVYWQQLDIRRLPMNCTDSGKEMREKNFNDHENLPFIHLW